MVIFRYDGLVIKLNEPVTFVKSQCDEDLLKHFKAALMYLLFSKILLFIIHKTLYIYTVVERTVIESFL